MLMGVSLKQDGVLMKMDEWKPVVGRPKHNEYQKILMLRKEGFTYDAISIILNVSRQTIATICQLNQLGRRIR